MFYPVFLPFTALDKTYALVWVFDSLNMFTMMQMTSEDTKFISVEQRESSTKPLRRAEVVADSSQLAVEPSTEIMKLRSSFVDGTFKLVNDLQQQEQQDALAKREIEELEQQGMTLAQTIKRKREELNDLELFNAQLRDQEVEIRQAMKRRRKSNWNSAIALRTNAERLAELGTDIDVNNLQHLYSGKKEEHLISVNAPTNESELQRRSSLASGTVTISLLDDAPAYSSIVSCEAEISTAGKVKTESVKPEDVHIPSLYDAFDSKPDILPDYEALQVRPMPESMAPPLFLSPVDLLQEAYVPDDIKQFPVDGMPRDLFTEHAVPILNAFKNNQIVLVMARKVPLKNGSDAAQFVVYHNLAHDTSIGASLYAVITKIDSATNNIETLCWFDSALDWPRDKPSEAFPLKLRPLNSDKQASFVGLQKMGEIAELHPNNVPTFVSKFYSLLHHSDGGVPVVVEPVWAEPRWRILLPLEYTKNRTHTRSCLISGVALNMRGSKSLVHGRVSAVSVLIVEPTSGQQFWLPCNDALFELIVRDVKDDERRNNVAECRCLMSFTTRLVNALGQKDDGQQMTIDFFSINKSRSTHQQFIEQQQATGAEQVQKLVEERNNNEHCRSEWNRFNSSFYEADAYSRALTDFKLYQTPVDTNCVQYMGVSKQMALLRDAHGNVLGASDEELLLDNDDNTLDNYRLVPLDADGTVIGTRLETAKRSCTLCGMDGGNKQTHHKPNHGQDRMRLSQTKYRQWYNSLVKRSGKEEADKFIALVPRK